MSLKELEQAVKTARTAKAKREAKAALDAFKASKSDDTPTLDTLLEVSERAKELGLRTSDMPMGDFRRLENGEYLVTVTSNKAGMLLTLNGGTPDKKTYFGDNAIEVFNEMTDEELSTSNAIPRWMYDCMIEKDGEEYHPATSKPSDNPKSGFISLPIHPSKIEEGQEYTVLVENSYVQLAELNE